MQSKHYTQGCKGPPLYARLCRPSTVCRAVKALDYMQGCSCPALCSGLYRLYTCRLCTIRRAFCPCSIRRVIKRAALYARLCRPSTIHRAVQALSERLVQPCVECRACTALRRVHFLSSPAYSAIPAKPCVQCRAYA